MNTIRGADDRRLYTWTSFFATHLFPTPYLSHCQDYQQQAILRFQIFVGYPTLCAPFLSAMTSSVGADACSGLPVSKQVGGMLGSCVDRLTWPLAAAAAAPCHGYNGETSRLQK